MNITPVGLDFGNTQVKICIDGKNVSIPSMYAFDKPVILNKQGKQVNPRAFSLLFRQESGDDLRLWFGQDVLASQETISRFDLMKYDSSYISILFRAALHAWSKKHRVEIAELGKLSIVTSMPPEPYSDSNKRSLAERVYSNAFNRGQSHVKIRTGKLSIQIVTHFQKMIRECVAFGQDIPRKGELVLAFDLGGGTNDIALFNGSDTPIRSKTINSGLMHVWDKINPVNPREAELAAINGKRSHPALLSYYNDVVENTIGRLIRATPGEISRVYIIGGGAALMPKSIRAIIKKLPANIIIKDEFVNAEMNWKEARK